MSLRKRDETRIGGDIDKLSAEPGSSEGFKGFEGMNYEQVRQPFNPQYPTRSSSENERNADGRPDEV